MEEKYKTWFLYKEEGERYYFYYSDNNLIVILCRYTHSNILHTTGGCSEQSILTKVSP